MIRSIQTENAPAAVGPYSQAVQVGDFIYCSGQIGIDPKTGTLKKGVAAQTKQALNNLSAVLTASQSDLRWVVKTTLYLTDIKDYEAVNTLYEKAFSGHHPARATVCVSALPKGALIEIDAYAIRAYAENEEEGCCGGNGNCCGN